jgi:ribonuclease HIII
MSLTKSFNPMEKILLKQAARIIDHLVESKPEDVNWELIDRFQDLLERYLTKEKKKLPTNERTAA